MQGKPLFQAGELIFSLGPDGPRRRASFFLEPGQAVWIIGRSGAGKTSLLKVLAGLRPRLGGDLFLDGREADNHHPPAWRRKVVYLPQKPVMLPGTVEDNISLAFRFHTASGTSFPRDRAITLLESLELKAEVLQKTAGALSGGEQSRVSLVRALLIGPRVVLVDEPLAHLDSASRELVSAALAEHAEAYSAGVVFVSHDPLNWPKAIEEVAIEGEF